MQSVKSYFNPTLFKKNLTRFWPIWALFAAIWFLVLPVGIFTQPSSYDTIQTGSLVLSMISTGLILSIPFALLATMAVFSYLYQSRSVAMMHALPIRREGLFLTNYLSGLCFLLGPLVLIFFLALGAEALKGTVFPGHLLTWLVSQILICLFFYSFAVFCAMFTGNLLALPAFYGILNFLAYALCFLLGSMMQQFVFGFSSFRGMERVATLFTPAMAMAQKIQLMSEVSMGDVYTYTFTGMGYLIVYAVVGLALTALALLAYKKRHAESAGDIISVSWVQPIFKYGVTFCTAISLGTLLQSIFFSYQSPSPWTLLAFMVFSGILGYFIAEMLLKKTFRVFHSGWKGCLAAGLVLVAATCGMHFDVTGFERRIPNADAISQVRVSRIFSLPDDAGRYIGFDLTDPEDIAQTLRIHSALVAERESLKTLDTSSHTTQQSNGKYIESYTTTTVDLCYFLQDGSSMTRTYDIPVTDALLADPTSPVALLTDLINRPHLVELSYLRSIQPEDQLTDGALTLYNPQTGETSSHALDISKTQLETLLAAVKEDMAAGRIGRRYLLDNMDRLTNCYYNDLEFYFRRPGEPSTFDRSEEKAYSFSVSITLQTTSTETLRVLKELNLITDDQLITHYENRSVPLTVNSKD